MAELLLDRLDVGAGGPHGAVVVVDEAGMVGTRQLAETSRFCGVTPFGLGGS